MPGFSAHDLVSDESWDEWSELPEELLESPEDDAQVTEPDPGAPA